MSIRVYDSYILLFVGVHDCICVCIGIYIVCLGVYDCV